MHSLHQFIGDVGALKPHDTLLRAAEAQQIDAPVPYNFLIQHREFMVDV